MEEVDAFRKDLQVMVAAANAKKEALLGSKTAKFQVCVARLHVHSTHVHDRLILEPNNFEWLIKNKLDMVVFLD